jgi:DNA-binding response OmpR family regulator
MQARFLLLGGTTPTEWVNWLRQRLSAFGDSDYLPAQDLVRDEVGAYDIIFIDATEVGLLQGRLAELRGWFPSTSIVVLTASPTWKRARAAFEAGATDYLSKSMPEEHFYDVVETLLARRNG